MYVATKKYFLIVVGWIALALGVIGIVIPLLPTTPFILLSAACFANSSPRFHKWLVTHKFFGPIIENFKSGRGVPIKVRNTAIVLIWVTMSFSMFMVGKIWSTVLLICIGSGVTIYLLRLPVYESPRKQTSK